MEIQKKRILICASACRPKAGSEPGVGWAVYQLLRKKYEVKVVCSSCGREAIREAAELGHADFKDFEFIEERIGGSGYPAIDKLTCWLNFFSFQRRLAKQGRRLVESFRPDLIHQVTLATWRAGNPLAGSGPPFVWGPIGGGETLPMPLLGQCSAYSKAFEVLRAVSGWLSQRSSLVKITARTADHIFASNRETYELVASIRRHQARMDILPVVFFSAAKMHKFREPSLRDSAPGAPIQIFSGGYVEARKGIGLALRALARLKNQGFSFQYENSGFGPEKGRLESLIRQLGLADCARFVGSYPGDAYDRKLRATDVFLFPSLRDNCPATLLEAMGHGCVPVVADHAGPGEIVTSGCGVKIPITRPSEFVDRLTEELAKLFGDADRRRRLGEAARLRVIQKFSEENWLSLVEHVYFRLFFREQTCARKGPSPGSSGDCNHGSHS